MSSSQSLTRPLYAPEVSSFSPNQRISPGAVQIVRLPEGKGIKGILFRFPKKLLERPSTLSIDDNDLKFISQAGITQIKASFDLQKMVDNEGMDL
jgi:hypothetical protein